MERAGRSFARERPPRPTLKGEETVAEVARCSDNIEAAIDDDGDAVMADASNVSSEASGPSATGSLPEVEISRHQRREAVRKLVGSKRSRPVATGELTVRA